MIPKQASFKISVNTSKEIEESRLRRREEKIIKCERTKASGASREKKKFRPDCDPPLVDPMSSNGKSFPITPLKALTPFSNASSVPSKTSSRRVPNSKSYSILHSSSSISSLAKLS
uniref:Uncharacterized protein n=1 Tax=Cucumis sativus TaxID=3659 RepID=A0A0A0KPL9_CUCSA